MNNLFKTPNNTFQKKFDKNSYIKVVECKKALKWNEILRY